MSQGSSLGATAAACSATVTSLCKPRPAHILVVEGGMLASVLPGGPQVQCLPSLAQLANATACPAWRRTLPGACELTSLRDWRPTCAAPPPHSLSRRTQRSRRAVPTGATVDVPDWDVVALGQSMVDISAYVDDVFIEQMGVAKGGRRIIDVQERAQLLEALDGSSYQVSAGGSLSNSIVGVARLGMVNSCLTNNGPLNIGMLSVAGSDAQGAFHNAQMQQAGVQLLSSPCPGSATGTVIVMTTPDANRTFMSYLGSSQELQLTSEAEAAISSTRLLVIEGYLWEMKGASKAIGRAISIARGSGATVVLTTGDPGLVARHREDFWEQLSCGNVDVLCANREEAEQLLGRQVAASEAALELGSLCSVAAITDGPNGSYISALGRLQAIPPFWREHPPVDTCGAGDAYTAGFLYGFLSGLDVASMGRFSARVASAVISRPGACLSAPEARHIVEQIPALAEQHRHGAILAMADGLSSPIC